MFCRTTFSPLYLSLLPSLTAMSHGYGSEVSMMPYIPHSVFWAQSNGQRKNRRSRRPPSPSNSRTSPTERCYSRNYNENQLIFPMSLPQSTPDTQPVVRPVNSRHTSRYPLTESQRSTPYSSPSLGGARLNGAPFFGSSVSDTSATSPGSEGFASFQRRDYPIIPQRPPQPQPAVHINPQTGRVLTAADFARRHPRKPSRPRQSSATC